MANRVWLSWSTGKDSAWALHVLRQQSDIEVVGLLTTVNSSYGRVAIHSTRLAIVEAQARAAGLSLYVVPLPWPCSNEIYEDAMRRALEDARKRDVTHVAFGDLFLEDIRAYRVRQMADTGLEPIFPLWQQPTSLLARRMIDAGLEAVLTCVDPKKLSPSFVGRRFDHTLLGELPPDVDPCGENGEFHTCVIAGPMFRERLPVIRGDVVARDGFWFADMLLTSPCDA